MKAELVSVNPFTEEEIERFAAATDGEVETALAQAEKAQRDWRKRSFSERGKVLLGVADLLHSERDALAKTATLEMGKPLTEAQAEVDKCAKACRFFAEHGEAFLREEVTASEANKSSVVFDPLGVVLAVMPWNFPYWQAVRALAPALMAGNAMILKHAEATSRCSLELDRVLQKAGAPSGVFRSLILPAERVAALIADRRIAAVTLTGSERAGVSVAKAAGAALKKCVLELGGSDPFVVLADADVASAARVAVRARFQNNGQSCIAAKRFIVVAEVADAFIAGFCEEAKKLRAGDPLLATTTLGPMARRDLRDGLAKQVDAAIVAGGKAQRFTDVPQKGFFYPATLVVGGEGSPIFSEETFGPVAALHIAKDESAAIAFANQTQYGLGASLWTGDQAKAERLARDIDAGSVFVNAMVASDPRVPFGGVKLSGYGRELAAFGMREFVNVKTLWIS